MPKKKVDELTEENENLKSHYMKIKEENEARGKVLAEQRDYILERIDMCNKYALVVDWILDKYVGAGDEFKDEKAKIVNEAWEFAGKELDRMKKEIVEQNKEKGNE